MADRSLGVVFVVLGLAVWATLLSGVFDLPANSRGAAVVYGFVGALAVATGVIWYRNPPA
jgi:hypothetical protein